VRQRLERRERRPIDICRLVLRYGFHIWYLFHRWPHFVTEVLHEMERHGLVCAADKITCRGIAQKKRVIVVSGIERGNRMVHRARPRLPVNEKYRALKRVLCRDRAAFRGARAEVDIGERLTSTKCCIALKRTPCLLR